MRNCKIKALRCDSPKTKTFYQQRCVLRTFRNRPTVPSDVQIRSKLAPSTGYVIELRRLIISIKSDSRYRVSRHQDQSW
ncbi:hypothetical protein HBH56_238220 [Parastagonospora nodorum]|nr:hypothetical protein HBH56_238220 [Parastagonospora nodorum]